MSKLKDSERRALVEVLGMGGGRVLDYTRAEFRDFFASHEIDIEADQYQIDGPSMGKRLRAFWKIGPDEKVGRVLDELVDAAKALSDEGRVSFSPSAYQMCLSTVEGLLGTRPSGGGAEDAFLSRKIGDVDLTELPIDGEIVEIVERRLQEARIAINAGAHLSVVFLCGSLLEAALIGAARRNPNTFNQSPSAPKRNGKVLPIADWKLVQLIDVAESCGVISPDVKQFSHRMRDFRNYIHPAKELQSGFTPDSHTAQLCLQALLAAFANLTGRR